LFTNFSLAAAPWATSQDVAFSLWGGGNFAAFAWGSGPDFIAEYACQGAFILEKARSECRLV
jgi:hypothetical protein